MRIIRPADVLIPKLCDMSAWSVIACDQFTSQKDYWYAAYDIVGDKPSTLNMILPEAFLDSKNADEEGNKIFRTMTKYLESGIFAEYKDSYIYLERSLSSGKIRRGLICMIDLEYYDWAKGTKPLIRATERTVEDRLPPRVAIRQKAVLEMPHIMVFFDDPDEHVFSSVVKGESVYDFELMQNGGHVKGWRVADNSAVENAFSVLSSEDELKSKYGRTSDPMILAMGDGNHSIAAAKLHWESVKKSLAESERDCHPARFALCELVNIHDDAICFEPIHKVIFNTEPSEFIESAKAHFSGNSGEGKTIKLITAERSQELSVCGMTYGELIASCEELCEKYVQNHGGTIDYIHGDNECESFSKRTDGAGIMLPRLNKSELFSSVMQSGPFPKKSFSIGHAEDKRYYLECRKIV